MVSTAQQTIRFQSGKYSYSLKNTIPRIIYSVTGIYLTSNFTFNQGTDYILDGNNVVWSQTSTTRRPDLGTDFNVIYEYDPVLTPIPFTDEQYGRDMRLFEDDIRGDSSGDAEQIKFQKNVLDALRHRLLTDRGELLRHPNYGSRLSNLMGLNITPTNIELARLYVVECINQDPRVDKIVSVDITPDYANRALQIDVVFTTIVNHETLNLVYNYFLEQAGYVYQ